MTFFRIHKYWGDFHIEWDWRRWVTPFIELHWMYRLFPTTEIGFFCLSIKLHLYHKETRDEIKEKERRDKEWRDDRDAVLRAQDKWDAFFSDNNLAI